MPKRKCLHCKKIIVGSDKRQKYCSRSCSASHTQLGKPSKNRKYASADAKFPTCVCGERIDSFAPKRNTCKKCIAVRKKERKAATKQKLKLKELALKEKRRIKQEAATYRRLHPVKRKSSYTPEERRTYQMAYYHKRKQELINIRGGKCVDCGATEHLEFDHTKPETKLFAIGVGILSKKWELVVSEAKKCKLRCRACHLKRTVKLGHTKSMIGVTPKCAKLTPMQVHSISKLLPKMTQQAIADRFGVSRGSIKLIKSGKSYRNVV